MSSRVVAIKILGLGETTSNDAAVFTTRVTGLYTDSVAGTVVSLANQLSSEIQVFSSMGSDSTTSFTVLSTVATRRLLLSRGKQEVYDAAYHQPVRLTGYVSPINGTVEIPVPDPALFTLDGYYRVQNTVFKIATNSGTLTGDRVWGCANVPIAMTRQGVGNEPLGSIVYDVNGVNPLGGCEQLPVVITTEELDGSDKEVIFRGYVNKVSNDTSAGQQNLIKVDCSSMMAYIKQAPFIPAWGPVTVSTTRGSGRIYQTGGNAAVIQTIYQTPWLDGVYGTRYDDTTNIPGDTVVNLWQIREDGKGGINTPLLASESEGDVRLLNQIALEFDGTIFAGASNNSYAMMFNGGYYEQGGSAFGPSIEFSVDVGKIRNASVNHENSRAWSADATVQAATVKGENCFESASFYTAIIDLLLGTHDSDITLSSGARSATESAWLPYEYASIGELIHLPSLYALLHDLQQPDMVEITPGLVVTEQTLFRAILPYQHASAKTVGEVLEEILKRLGAYMVYDKGKFYFGSWAGARSTPTPVTDDALSDPAVKLTFDRATCLMRVTAKYCTNVIAEVVTYEVPYLNVDLAASALGKEMSVGHWFSGAPHNPDSPFWGNTRMMANAFGLIMRYSQSAARIDLSLRDSEVDLQIGQEVALTSSYIVNSKGEMGISALTGYVLKAARSWATPTTAYTIILPGYVSVSNKIPVWSCSAIVIDQPGDFIDIEPNAFVAPAGLFDTGAPYNDAQAFQYTHDLMGSWYDVQLLDQYGTFKAQTALESVDVAANKLELPGFSGMAGAGDIIVLADATAFGSTNINNIYDVFQASNAGQVLNSTANARKWVP